MRRNEDRQDRIESVVEVPSPANSVDHAGSHVLSLNSVLCRTDFVSQFFSLFQSACLPLNDFTGSESRVKFSWGNLAWQII